MVPPRPSCATIISTCPNPYASSGVRPPASWSACSSLPASCLRRPRRQPAAKRPPHRSRTTRSRSTCRSIRRSSSAGCPTACATTSGRTRSPPRQAELRLVVKAGSVLEDDDQRGLAHFVEHMQFQGSRHFPGQSIARLPVVARLEHRRGRERRDEFRRHAVHAARADRSSGRPRHGADRARRLGGRRALRARRHRAAAPDRPRRMAPQSRRRRTDRREVAPRAAGGIALRGPRRRSGSRR